MIFYIRTYGMLLIISYSNSVYGMHTKKPYVTLILPQKAELLIPAEQIDYSFDKSGKKVIRLETSENKNVILEKNFIVRLIQEHDLGALALRSKKPEQVLYTADYIHLKKQAAFLATMGMYCQLAKGPYKESFLQKLHPVHLSYNNFERGHLCITDPECNTLYKVEEELPKIGIPCMAINHLTLAMPQLDGIHPNDMQRIIRKFKNLRTVTIENTAIRSLYKNTFKNLPSYISLIIKNNKNLQNIESSWCEDSYKGLSYSDNAPLSSKLRALVYPHLKPSIPKGIIHTGCEKIWHNLTQLCTTENRETIRNITLDAALIAVNIVPKGTGFYKYATLKALEARYIKHDPISVCGLGMLSCANIGTYTWYMAEVLRNNDFSEEERINNISCTTGLFVLSMLPIGIHMIQKLNNTSTPYMRPILEDTGNIEEDEEELEDNQASDKESDESASDKSVVSDE